MVNKQLPTDWLDRVKKSWGTLAQSALWIICVVGSFLLPPPVGFSGSGQHIWTALGKFVVTVLVGLMIVAGRKWNKKGQARAWAIVAAALLVVAVSTFISYQSLLFSHTCTYSSKEVVIGNVYTEHALTYLQKYPGKSCEALLEDFVGKADDIWTQESINHERTTLAEVYLSCLPLFAMCMMAIVHAVYLEKMK